MHLERLDDRRIKRLDDDRRLHGNDLALAGDNAVELGEARCGEQAYDHRRQDPQCRAHASRLRGREDLGSLAPFAADGGSEVLALRGCRLAQLAYR